MTDDIFERQDIIAFAKLAGYELSDDEVIELQKLGECIHRQQGIDCNAKLRDICNDYTFSYALYLCKQ